MHSTFSWTSISRSPIGLAVRERTWILGLCAGAILALPGPLKALEAVGTPSATESTPQAAAWAPKSRAVLDIVKLHDAKIQSSVILAYIQNSKTGYHLQADDLVFLHQKGVEDDLISAMLNHPEPNGSALQNPVPVATPNPNPAPQATEAPFTPAPTTVAPVTQVQPVYTVAEPSPVYTTTYIGSPYFYYRPWFYYSYFPHYRYYHCPPVYHGYSYAPYYRHTPAVSVNFGYRSAGYSAPRAYATSSHVVSRGGFRHGR